MLDVDQLHLQLALTDQAQTHFELPALLVGQTLALLLILGRERPKDCSAAGLRQVFDRTRRRLTEHLAHFKAAFCADQNAGIAGIRRSVAAFERSETAHHPVPDNIAR